MLALTIGSVIGIIGIIIAWLSYERKVPCWWLEGHVLVEGGLSEYGELELFFGESSENDHVKVDRVTVTDIFLWNAGRKTIDGTDIARGDPLRVEMVTDDEMLKAGIVHASRDVIKPAIVEFSPKTTKVSFDFLDKGDGVVVRILHTGRAPADCQVIGTIKGVPKGLRRITKRGPHYHLRRVASIILNLTFFACWIMAYVWIMSGELKEEQPYVYYGFWALLGIHAVLSWGADIMLDIVPEEPPAKLRGPNRAE